MQGSAHRSIARDARDTEVRFPGRPRPYGKVPPCLLCSPCLPPCAFRARWPCGVRCWPGSSSVGFVALGFAFGPGAHADDRTRNVDLPGASAPARPAAEASTPDRAATRDGANRISGSGSAVTQRGEASGAKVAERTHAASDEVAGAVRPAAEQTAPVTGR